jgi:hypothetical protein
MSLKYVCYSPEKDLINGNHSIDEHSAQYLASIFLQLRSVYFIYPEFKERQNSAHFLKYLSQTHSQNERNKIW